MLPWSGSSVNHSFPRKYLLVRIHTSKKCEMCSKLTIKSREQRQWRLSGVFIVNFEHILYLFLVFPLVTLSNQILTQFFLHCHHFNHFFQTLLDFIEKIVKDISDVRENTLVNFLLYISLTYNLKKRPKIIKALISYILNTETCFRVL